MEKIYCGNAKIVKTKFGEITKISMHKDDINKIVKHMKENTSDWINLEVLEKKEKKEGKPTHYVSVDMWKPESKESNTQSSNSNDSDDLPF
jgi:hypothetical protein